MTPPPSPKRRKLRLLRAGDLPSDATLLIRATPASVDAAVTDLAAGALDSAEIYEVELPDGRRVSLYAVSVFSRPGGADPNELLRRFPRAPCYLEASVAAVRSAGFAVLPTGATPEHYDILLVGSGAPVRVSPSMAELTSAARRLVEVCGEMRPNPSYAGGVYG